jgi:nitrogen fixation protein FixH
MINRYRAQPRSYWHLFPWCLAGGISVVMLANAALVWFAVTSFPGLATEHGFANSNSYDRVLQAAQQQMALGWRVELTLADFRPVITLTGRDGTPLAGAILAATAERPVGTDAPVPLGFQATAPGRFEADAPLAPGRWDLDLTVTGDGHTYRTVRRLVVK